MSDAGLAVQRALYQALTAALAPALAGSARTLEYSIIGLGVRRERVRSPVASR